MGKRRGVLTVLATAATSFGLVFAPTYASLQGRATSFEVNGYNSLYELSPVAISILGLFSNRLRLFAGFLMLVWVVAASFSGGFFYIPIAAFLLWPSKDPQDDGKMITLR